MGRNAGGVNGMDLDKDDYVVSMDAVQPDFEIIAKEHNTTTQNLEGNSKTSRLRSRW